MRPIALTLTLLFAATAIADEPVDGGTPPADAAPLPADAAPAAAAPPRAAAAPPPVDPAPKPAPPLTTTAAPADVAAHARPTPLYRSALFWTSLIVGAGVIAAIGVGAGLAESFHPRYALVRF